MSPPYPPEARPTKLPEAVTSEVLDELVVYSPASSQAVSLNRTARAIWELCDGTRDIEAICLELSEAAGTTPQSIRSDVEAALKELDGLGLLAAHER